MHVYGWDERIGQICVIFKPFVVLKRQSRGFSFFGRWSKLRRCGEWIIVMMVGCLGNMTNK